MKKNLKQKLNRKDRWVALALLSLFCCLIFGIWMSSGAWYRDGDRFDISVTLATIEVDSNTDTSLKHKIWVALRHQEVLTDDVTFSISPRSAEFYARIGVFVTTENETSQVAKDIIKYQNFVPTPNEGYSWVRDGEWYYFCDTEGKPAVLGHDDMGKAFGFMSKESFVMPEGLRPQHYAKDDSVELEIRVESVQARHVDASSPTNLAPFFKTSYPTKDYSVTFKDLDGTTLKTQTVRYAGDVTPPSAKQITGKVFQNWNTLIDGTGADIYGEEFNNISQDLVLYPRYMSNEVTVNVVQTANGEITPGTSTTTYGSDLNFVVKANSGYQIESISVGGSPVSITDNNEQIVELKNIVGDTTLTATYGLKEYIISVLSEGEGQTTPNSNQTAHFGDNVEFSFVANEGKYISSLIIDGIEKISGKSTKEFSFTFENISGDHSIYVSYETNVYQVDTYVLPYSDGFVYGEISPVETTCAHGKSVNFVVSAFDGARITSIKVGGQEKLASNDLASTNIVVSPTSDTNIVVCFAPIWKMTVINSKYYITDYLGSSSNVVVPSKIYDPTTQTLVPVYGIRSLNSDIITNLSVSNGIEYVGGNGTNNIFSQTNSNITTVSLPNSIKIIDSYAFLGCSQLTNFSMPSQLEKIGDYAFKDCSNIKAYDMPSTLQQIGVGAFNGNAGLAQLTFNSTTAPTISDGNIFSGTTSELKVRVPANSKAGYVSQLSNRSFAEDTYMYALTGETHLAVCKQNVFRYVYNIDIINGTGGTCDPEAGRVEVYQTQNFAVTFTPLTGNRIEGVYVDSSSDNIVSVAEGDPQTYTFENIQASHMIEVVYSKMYIRLDINGGTGQQPLVVYNDDKSKFRINDNIEPTKSGKEFYYYSTNPSDNEQGQNGDRYDLGLWYDIPNIQSSTTLYAIYLTPSASYTTSQEYIVVPKTVAALSGSSSNNIFGNNQDSIVKYITLHRNTTTIGAYSFNSLGALVGISHSDGVSILGEYAFASCSALTKYRFATMTTSIGESVFEKCVSLERIFNFENTTISTIPTRAFQYCSNLTEINVPNSITAIGEYAFSDSNLASIHLGKTKTAALGNFCFYNCTNLYNIIVSQELGTVGESAFENCENLRTVQDFENTKVTTIYSRAFYNCSNLPSIKLPQTLTLLGVSAFENCSKLTGVSGLENTSITKLSEKTFYKCSTLSNISLPTTLTQIDGSAAWDCVALKNINGLSSTKVTKIGANAFKNTKGLTQITLPTSTFTTFEANCFEGSGLQKITNLKNCSKLATFGISSFDGSGLKEISFPAKSFTIAANAFKNCISLVDVTFNNATAPTVDATSFDGTTNNLKVYIPDGKLDAYAPLQLGGIHNKGFSSGVDSIITAYTAVDYIHFSGAQYIDTEFVPTADTAVEVAFNTSTDGKWLFGSRTAYQSKDTYAIHLYTGSNSIWFQYAGSVPSQQTVSAYSGKKTTVKVDKDYMYVNGNKINSTAFGISGFTTGTWPMFLGEINNNGSKDGRSFIGDIYSFKVWQGSTLVRDMIPCIRNSDGAAGMYDKVEGKFYGNAGSGSLTTGATNSNIVEEYKRLEYIQSSGTQYINTGYWWRTENVQVVLDANIVSAPGSQSLFGSEEHIHGSDWSGRRFAIIPHGGNGSYSLYAYNGSKMTVKIANGKDFVLDISSKASGNTKTLKYNLNIDGAVSSNTASYTGNYGVRTNPDNLTNGLGQIYLFANHNSGSGMYNNASGTPNMNATQIIGGMKVYSFKLYDDGVCVRDYVPALRTRDGEVGLFDQQNGVFYQNAGSGKFTAGAIVDSDAAIKNGATMHYIGKSQTIATCINDMFKRHFNPTMADADYFFTGEVRTMAIKEELPEGASVSYTWKSTDGDSGSGNQFRDVGTYFVTATISGNFYVSTSVTAKLNISRPSLSGITFQDKSFVYDGTKKSITITGTLPEGATVSYSIKGINGESVDAGATNGTTEVGVYLVTATFGGTLEGNALTATLTITKATKTISLSDKTVTYNGSNHTIVIPTLPSGMSVSSSSVTGKEYDSNHNLSVDVSANQTGSDVITRTNAGVYAITVNFSGGRNYNDTSSSANLTINIADPGNISFLATNAYNGKGWTYDGTTHTITPNAPEGVEITYSYTGTYSGTDNKIKHAGEYTLVANIHGGSNYYDASTSVSFVVTKANLSATLNELVVTYTGSPHTYTLTNKVQGVGEDGQFNPSSCTIVYSYSGKVFVEDDTTEPTGATVSSTGNTATNAGWYSMKLEISTTSDYNTLTISSTNNFRINKANSSFAVSEIWALSGTTFKNPFNFDSITSQIITYTSSDTEKVKIQTSDGVVSFLVTSIINDRTSSTEASEVTITATSKNVATKTFVIHLIPFSYYSSEKDVDYTSSKPNHNGGVLFQATLMPNKIVDGVIMGERETLAVEGIDSWALSSNYEYGPVELEEGIKTIGQYAFEESKITAVLLPSTLTSFGESAFRNSTVTSINIPDGITAITNRCFQGCTSLPTITFPSALKTLGQYAFSGCSLFSAITLPTSVTLIDDGCFYSCTSLQSINIPNGISALSSYCFYNCTSLNNLSIPMSVQTINKYCFYQCTSFSDTVVLPIYLTSIGESAFQKCTGIKNIKFLNEDNSNIHEEDNYYRLSLGSSAFSDCVNLENFDDFICCNPTEKINSNGESTISYDYYVKTKNYGYRSFYNCSSLIGVGVFANGLNLLEYQEDKKEQVMLALSLYGISSNVDALGFRITLLASTGGSNVADAIVMATILSQSFTLHDSKLVIEDKAFYNCQSLLMFDLYSVGADVGAMAFYNCNELYLVKRLNGKVNFQNGAFTNCGNFKNPTRYCCFDETQKITAGSNVFSGSYVFLITLENKVEQVISIFQDCACINDMICRITSSFVVDDEVTYAVRVNDKWAHIFYLKAMVEHSYQSINVTSIGPTIDYAWRAESDYVQEDDWLVKKFWFVEGATVTITYKRTTGMVCYCSFNSDNYFGSVAGSSSNTKSYSFTSNGNYYAKMWT